MTTLVKRSDKFFDEITQFEIPVIPEFKNNDSENWERGTLIIENFMDKTNSWNDQPIKSEPIQVEGSLNQFLVYP